MTFVAGPKTGLPTNIDLDDTTWTEKYLTGNTTLENRISLTSSGDPNGAVVGSWYGQPCWNSARSEVWECVKPGPATGSTRALWIPRSPVPVGAVSWFFRSTIPTGWIAFDGSTYLRSSYPYLYDVLPAGATRTANDFTLPNVRGGILVFRWPDGSEPVYPLVGQHNASTPFASAPAAYGGSTLNVMLGVKY